MKSTVRESGDCSKEHEIGIQKGKEAHKSQEGLRRTEDNKKVLTH